jgi:transcriptional regulator
MYLRPAFTETDRARIAGLISENPFGLLVTHGAGGLDASPVPFVMTQNNTELVLTGHLAAGNAQCAALAGGAAMAVFGGPHAYISPGWYRTQPAVPTWDYAAVHVHGSLERLEGEALMDVLRALAQGDPGGFDVDAMEPGYRDGMLKAIRGFRLRAERIEAQWKMSQNRSTADREGVISALRAQGENAAADLVAATLPAD